MALRLDADAGEGGVEPGAGLVADIAGGLAEEPGDHRPVDVAHLLEGPGFAEARQRHLRHVERVAAAGAAGPGGRLRRGGPLGRRGLGRHRGSRRRTGRRPAAPGEAREPRDVLQRPDRAPFPVGDGAVARRLDGGAQRHQVEAVEPALIERTGEPGSVLDRRLPCDRLEQFACRRGRAVERGKALLPVPPRADEPRRIAGHDPEGRHVLAQNRSGADDRARPDRDARKHHRAGADPDVVAHHDVGLVHRLRGHRAAVVEAVVRRRQHHVRRDQHVAADHDPPPRRAAPERDVGADPRAPADLDIGPVGEADRGAHVDLAAERHLAQRRHMGVVEVVDDLQGVGEGARVDHREKETLEPLGPALVLLERPSPCGGQAPERFQ